MGFNDLNLKNVHVIACFSGQPDRPATGPKFLTNAYVLGVEVIQTKRIHALLPYFSKWHSGPSGEGRWQLCEAAEMRKKEKRKEYWIISS